VRAEDLKNYPAKPFRERRKGRTAPVKGKLSFQVALKGVAFALAHVQDTPPEVEG